MNPFRMLSPLPLSLNSTLGIQTCINNDDRLYFSQKIVKEQNMNYKKWVGIDVSKDSLDISIFDGNNHLMSKIKNERNSILSFFKKFKSKSRIHSIMEATGIYHKRLSVCLFQLGIDFSVVNPYIIKKYAEMKMLRAKTDSVDARLIAEFGFTHKPDLYKFPPKEQEDIFKLIKVMNAFQCEITSFNNRLKAEIASSVGNAIIIKEYKRIIANMKKSIEKIEKEMHILVKVHYDIIYNKLIKIPGVADKTASVIIGYFGKFEEFETAKQVVSFVGLNPNPRQSGKSVNKGSNISKRGNPLLRKKLYMSAISAAHYNPNCMALYERLLNKGKSKVKALVAVAHKLLRQIFAVVKFEREWENNYISK